MDNFVVGELKTRLDKFLVSVLPEISRSVIQRYIEAGLVMVNGKVIKESKFVVRLGDEVKYQRSADPSFAKAMKGKQKSSESEIVATNTPLKILYNNHGLLIIDKPAGMVVHPGAGFKGETLASALLYQFEGIHLVGEDHRPGIVHRLDKDTSGIILVARTQEMYEHLKDAFLERKVKKEYIALVYGRLDKQQGFIETPMGKSKTDFRKQTTKDPVDGKEALTEYKVLEYLTPPSPLIAKDGGRQGVDCYTLVMVKLHTGRTHQIRVHFSSIGHPLIGDELYGGKKIKLKGLKRQFLHAKKIEVQLPDKTWIEAEADLPNDLKEVLVKLNSKIINKL